MKKNVGSTDRIIRIIVAAVFAILALTGEVTGTVAVILGILAVVLLLTSLVNFCPLYAALKISTRKDQPTA